MKTTHYYVVDYSSFSLGVPMKELSLNRLASPIVSTTSNALMLLYTADVYISPSPLML